MKASKGPSGGSSSPPGEGKSLPTSVNLNESDMFLQELMTTSLSRWYKEPVITRSLSVRSSCQRVDRGDPPT